MRHEPVVLIVDEQEVFDEMAPVLSRELATTHLIHCDNLPAAMAIIESEARLDLIFADWELSGPQFIHAVRHDKENHHTPLITLSGHDTDEVIAAAIRNGANDHLAKPFLTKGLLNKLARLTKTEERRRRRRLHPDRTYTITIALEDGEQVAVNLIDFSLEGCMTRGAIELCPRIGIGSVGTIHLEIGDYRIDLEAKLFRVEEDPGAPPPASTVLMTFRFVDDHDDRVEKLEELLDEYAACW